MPVRELLDERLGHDLARDEPITRAGPPSHSTAKSSATTGRTRTLCVTHSGTGVGATARPAGRA